MEGVGPVTDLMADHRQAIRAELEEGRSVLCRLLARNGVQTLIDGELRDVSEDGLGLKVVRTVRNLRPGRKVVADFVSHDMHFRLPAEVRHVSDALDGQVVGIQFRRFGAREHRVLEALRRFVGSLLPWS